MRTARTNGVSPKPKNDREMLDWAAKNPLARYMRKTDRTPEEMARRIGCLRTNIWKWLNGALPELHACYEMERVTGGAIPVEAWLVHPRSVEAIATWRAKRHEQ